MNKRIAGGWGIPQFLSPLLLYTNIMRCNMTNVICIRKRSGCEDIIFENQIFGTLDFQCSKFKINIGFKISHEDGIFSKLAFLEPFPLLLGFEIWSYYRIKISISKDPCTDVKTLFLKIVILEPSTPFPVTWFENSQFISTLKSPPTMFPILTWRWSLQKIKLLLPLTPF